MFYFYQRNLISKFQTLLIHAIEKGNLEIIKVLLNNSKIDINQIVIHICNFKFIHIISNIFLLFGIHFYNLKFIYII